MKISELLDQTAAEPAPVTPQQLAQQEPTQQDVQAVKQMINTLPKEPESALQKFDKFMDEYPVLDILTSFLPQTAIVKALINTASALEKGDTAAALTGIAGVIPGNPGRVAKRAMTAYNVGTAATTAYQALNPDTDDNAGTTANTNNLNTSYNYLESLDSIQRLAGLRR